METSTSTSTPPPPPPRPSPITKRDPKNNDNDNKNNPNLQFPLKTSHNNNHFYNHSTINNSPAFLSHNGPFTTTINNNNHNNIEMVELQAVTYTSLKDLLPASPPLPSMASPTSNSSWHEIPIKNPLVKQAALAYLQPMASPPQVGNDKGLFGWLNRLLLCGECGCVGWVNDVIVRALRELFCARKYEEIDEEEEEEEEEEDYYYHKVD